MTTEQRLKELDITHPNKPFRFALPFSGDSPIDRLPGRREGSPTQGILVIGESEVPLISGQGGMSDGLAQEGESGFTRFNQTHVEPQAVRILEMVGAEEGTVFINHAGGPCQARAGCRQNLEKMLPEGTKLRVVWPGGEQTFDGKKKRKDE